MTTRLHYRVAPERSAVLVEARSNVGPITFATSAIAGTIEIARDDERVSLREPPTAHLEVAVGSLVSGNTLYDAELHRRINARRFPFMSIELTEVALAGSEGRYDVAGKVTIQDKASVLRGVVTASLPDTASIVVLGEQRIDIRDFDITAPAVAMLKIYPDVRVLLHLEGEYDADGG